MPEFKYLLLPLAALGATMPAGAGDLESLPTSERGFQEKVQAFIKPGNMLEESLRFLEADRFECREFRNKHPVFHCSRMEAPRYYQVLIEPKGARVGTVTPSIGKVSR